MIRARRSVRRRRRRVRSAATLLAVAVAMGGGVAIGLRLNRTATTFTPIGGDGPEPSTISVPLTGKIKPPAPGDVYWGVFRDGAPYDTSIETGLENEVGRRPAILMWYQEWYGQPDFPAADAAWLYDRGIVPMISWEPWKPPKIFGELVVDQPKFRLARIAHGAFDAYIRRYATEIRNFGGPVLLRPFHEMDGFWYPWCGTVNGNTPAAFVAAWRHIHDIFRQVGATNTTWVWSVNHVTVPDTPENQIEHYWPGSHYVDWVGMSGFNWGSASPLSVWHGFDGVIQDRYRQLLAYHKPIMLTETGAPEVGGDKATWIKDSLADMLAHYPKLKAFIWYDRRDSKIRDWRLDSSPAALAAFRKAIANPRFLSANAAQATAIRNQRA